MKLLRAASLSLLLSSSCEEPLCAPATLAPLERTPAFAVVTGSRNASTAIALLDDDYDLITEAWIDSGTTSAGLSSTISSDLVLPSVQVDDSSLVMIDRLGTDVITQIAIPSGQVLRQVAAQRRLDDVEQESRFRANPYDVVAWTQDEWLVTRLEPNLRPGTEPLDLGNDIVRIDRDSGRITGRISFESADSHDGGDFLARPSMMARRGSLLVVGLGRLDELFRTGPGAVAVVDPATGRVATTELDRLRNCGEVVAALDDEARAFVLCTGDTNTDEPRRRMHSGIVRLRVDGLEQVVVERVWRTREHGNALSPSNGLVAMSGSRVAVNAMGDSGRGTTDAYVSVDVDSGDYDVLFRSSGAFVVGIGTWVAAERTLLVPDATDGLRVLRESGDGHFRLVKTLDVSACRGLPPREVRPLGAAPR